jgi:hypothetical protein
MKKGVILFALALLLLILFACDFNLPTIPTAIQITGSPSVRFAEKVDMTKMFTDIFDEKITEDEKISVFTCEQVQYFTYLIHMELFNEEFNIEIVDNSIDENTSTIPDFPGINNNMDGLKEFLDDLFEDTWNKTVTLEDEIELIKPDEFITLPLSSIGSFLEEFTFSEYKIKLYFSGSDIIDKSDIYISITESNTEAELDYIKYNPENKDSGYDNDNWKNGYTAAALPEGGEEITLKMDGKDLDVHFKVVIPKDTELELLDFQDGNMKVEVVIWLPFVFKAISDEAEIVFPEDSLFSSKDDLFGRDKPDEESKIADIIESLSMEIVFDKSPFNKGSDLIVWSGVEGRSNYIKMTNNLNNNSFPFVISEEDMKKINDPEKYPFTPNFKIKFPSESILRFPKEFNAVEFILKAKIKYRVDF